MNPNKVIKHEGIIEQISEVCYMVKIERIPACNNCAAEKYCNLSNDTDLIAIPKTACQQHNIGDRVFVIISQKTSWIALLFGYFLPCLILILGILISSEFSVSQSISGLTGLGSLLLYYIIFWMFRKKINRQFSFSIESVPNA